MAAENGGVSAVDPWLGELHELLDEEPLCDSIDEALEPTAAHGVDVVQIIQIVAAWLAAPAANWTESDWRRTHPEFPRDYAGAIYAYTLPCELYKKLNAAMRAPDRGGAAFCGCSAELRAWLPYAKFLDTALQEAGAIWGTFTGKCHRGVQFAFPKPTVAQHDPEKYFNVGRELNWFEFKSSSTSFETMYDPLFCGTSGPRTIFTVHSCAGISIKKFSAIEREEEVRNNCTRAPYFALANPGVCLQVLFRPMARFRVTYSQKKLLGEKGHLELGCEDGFPDEVHLEQIPNSDVERIQESVPPEREVVVSVVLVLGGKDTSGSECQELVAFCVEEHTWVPLHGACRMELLGACPRNQPAVCKLPDGKVLVAGGSLNGSPIKSVHIFDPSAGSWSAAADLPGPREAARAWLCGGRVFVTGGFDGSQDLKSTLEYDARTNCWVARTDMCHCRSFHGIAEVSVQDPATQDPTAREPVIVVAGGGEGPAQQSIVSIRSS